MATETLTSWSKVMIPTSWLLYLLHTWDCESVTHICVWLSAPAIFSTWRNGGMGRRSTAWVSPLVFHRASCSLTPWFPPTELSVYSPWKASLFSLTTGLLHVLLPLLAHSWHLVRVVPPSFRMYPGLSATTSKAHSCVCLLLQRHQSLWFEYLFS